VAGRGELFKPALRCYSARPFAPGGTRRVAPPVRDCGRGRRGLGTPPPFFAFKCPSLNPGLYEQAKVINACRGATVCERVALEFSPKTIDLPPGRVYRPGRELFARTISSPRTSRLGLTVPPSNIEK